MMLFPKSSRPSQLLPEKILILRLAGVPARVSRRVRSLGAVRFVSGPVKIMGTRGALLIGRETGLLMGTGPRELGLVSVASREAVRVMRVKRIVRKIVWKYMISDWG